MNKLFTKIAASVIGMAMAIGVGVAIGQKVVRDARAADSGTYSIVFKTNSTDGSTEVGTSTNASTAISSGTEYVASKPFTSSCSKAYYSGKSGIKLGSSSASGTVEITLADSYKTDIKKIKVYSAAYGSDTGTLSLFAGSTSLKTGITPGDSYEHTFDTVQTVSTIKVSTSSKRAYVSKIDITIENSGSGGGGGGEESTETTAGEATITLGSASGQWNAGTTATSDADDNGQTWTVSFTPSNRYTSSDGSVQFGSSSYNCTALSFVSSGFSQAMNLTEFTIKYGGSGNGATSTAALKVGSTNLKTGTGISGSATETLEWTGTQSVAASGTLNISFSNLTKGTKVFYIYYKLVDPSAPVTYSVTYHGNGASGTMTDSNSPYSPGTDVTVLNNGFTVPTGYAFDGWATSAQGAKVYDGGDTIEDIAADVSLYARWVETSDSYLHDVLNVGDFNATSTSYVTTTGIDGDSSTAVYCGSTGKGNGAIQINTSNGIGTSTTGGHLRKLKITWNSNTANGRSISIKGSNSAFSGNATSGTEIGTLVYNANFLTTISLFDSNTYYPYICFVGVGGALYIDSIDFGFEAVNPTSIPVTGDSSVYVGHTITLTATPTHANNWTMTNANYTWSSSDNTVAQVNQNGVVSGIAAGTAIIYATSDGDNTVKGSKTITVSEVPSYFISLSVSTDTGTDHGYIGDGLYVSVDESHLAGNINWSVSGGTISEQDGDNDGFTGYLASAGTITVTATDSGDNSNTASISVTSVKALNNIQVPNVSSKTWTATAAANLGAKISDVDGTDSGTLTFDDDSTMSYERTLEYVASGKSDFIDWSSPYIQFGSSNALETLVLTTNASVSNVKRVVVDCGSKSGNANVSVTVGGNAFDQSKSAPDSKGEVIFNGSASGVVEITMGKSTKTSGCAQYIASVSIVYSDGTSSNVSNANGYHSAQAAAIEYAEDFNSTLSAICVAYGTTDADDLSSAWEELSAQFTSWFVNTGKALSNEQKERALLMFAHADAVALDENHPNADALQQMLAKYDWIVSHYHYGDFLSSVADRAEVQQTARINPLVVNNSSNTAMIVVIISTLTLTTLGAFFFIKKRKEQ